jgi:hypothetical protein
LTGSTAGPLLLLIPNENIGLLLGGTVLAEEVASGVVVAVPDIVPKLKPPTTAGAGWGNEFWLLEGKVPVIPLLVLVNENIEGPAVAVVEFVWVVLDTPKINPLVDVVVGDGEAPAAAATWVAAVPPVLGAAAAKTNPLDDDDDWIDVVVVVVAAVVPDDNN